DHASVGWVHARAVGVENSHDAGVSAFFAIVGHSAGFGEAFGFFVHGAQADGVDVAPEIFALDVLRWVAVNFAGAGDEEAGFFFEGEVEEVPGSLRIHLHGFDAMGGVGDGGGGGGEV